MTSTVSVGLGASFLLPVLHLTIASTDCSTPTTVAWSSQMGRWAGTTANYARPKPNGSRPGRSGLSFAGKGKNCALRPRTPPGGPRGTGVRVPGFDTPLYP